MMDATGSDSRTWAPPPPSQLHQPSGGTADTPAVQSKVAVRMWKNGTQVNDTVDSDGHTRDYADNT